MSGLYRQHNNWLDRWQDMTGKRPDEKLHKRLLRHNCYNKQTRVSIRDTAAYLRSQRFLSTWDEDTGNAEEQEKN